jgi:hypothetical protein
LFLAAIKAASLHKLAISAPEKPGVCWASNSKLAFSANFKGFMCTSKIIENQYQRAIELLSEHKDKLSQLAELLLEKEVMFKDDLVKVFGERPFDKKEEKTNTVTEE